MSVLAVSSYAQSASSSKKIAEAVKSFKGVAESGIEVVQLRPNVSLKGALVQLAFKKQYIDSVEEMNWVGNSSEAWEADSANFGETTMKGAYQYLISIDKDLYADLEPKDKMALLANVKKAKEGFKLLMNTGVKFGVVPFGAVQCGVTFSALAVYDPSSGKLYIISKEGSGC